MGIDVGKELLSLQDPANAEFEARLTPCGHRFLGARLPQMRKLARRIAKDGWEDYLESWSPEYFEDYMLRGLVIAYVKVPVDERLRLYAEFVPLIDNWAVCDSFCSTWKPGPQEKERLWGFISPYLDSGQEFQARFALVMAISHFIDEGHIGRIIEGIERVRCDGYYCRMAVAWCLSACVADFPDEVLAYLQGSNSLDDWTFMKTVQKSLESYRVDDGAKRTLREMRDVRKGFVRQNDIGTPS